MYRQPVRCTEIVEDVKWTHSNGRLIGRMVKESCNTEVGYSLISHSAGKTLVTGRKRCPRCGAGGVNEAALLWDIMPAASSYIGPTLHEMALKALSE